jgi:GPH family glycoside/pentoside/hexuronide:cation symporter
MTNRSDRLPWYTKLLYGSADFGFAFTDTMIGVLFAIYLTDVVGLAPKLAALAIFIGKSWDYVNDPLFGHLTDRTRSRWGRRRPYLLFGFIPFGLAFVLMWWRPAIESQWGLAAYYAAAYFIWDGVVTLVSMPYFALTPELTQDYDERTSLTSYRMVFSLIGSLAAFVVPLMIIGTMRPENQPRILQTALIFAVASALSFLSTREKREYYQQSQPSIRESLRAAWKNRPFMFAAGIFLFTWTAIDIIQSMLLFFLKYRMNLEAQSDIVAAGIFVTALVFLPFWVWVSKKTDKRKAYIGGMLFLSVVVVSLSFVSPSLGFPAVMALACLAGFGASAVYILPWAIIPDAVEVDQLSTGARHEGMFYALVSLFKKVASSIAIPLALLVLDWSGYISNAPRQPESAVTAIRVLTGPVPAALFLAGIAFAFFYPLNRESHQETRRKIQARSQAEPGD